jgi:hypothetical protein
MRFDRIPEGELVIPALEIMEKEPNGEITTTALKNKIVEQFQPSGEDAEILDGRFDTKFTQKVRNLKSHKKLQKDGLADHIFRGFRITETGRRLVKLRKSRSSS